MQKRTSPDLSTDLSYQNMILERDQLELDIRRLEISRMKIIQQHEADLLVNETTTKARRDKLMALQNKLAEYEKAHG